MYKLLQVVREIAMECFRLEADQTGQNLQDAVHGIFGLLQRVLLQELHQSLKRFQHLLLIDGPEHIKP